MPTNPLSPGEENTDGIQSKSTKPLQKSDSKHPVLEVVIENSAATLVKHLPAWEQLVSAAIEPNVFYEPWMFLPALESFGEQNDFVFVLIFAPNPIPSAGSILCGFFPLVRKRRFLKLPIGVYSLWQHRHCYLGTPLVRIGYESECLAAFFRWAGSNSSQASLVELRSIPGEGPFRRFLIDHFRATQTPSFIQNSFTRALFKRRSNAEIYLQTACSGEKRKRLKRQERRLSELGKVEYRSLNRKEEVETWIEQFLEIEASGWKRQAGGALSLQESDRKFFTSIVREASARNQLSLLALHLDGYPIAMICDFVSRPGSFGFKQTFNEKYSRFGPGVLLEVESIRRLHAHPEIQWMDSCTSPDNTLLNGLWLDRLSIETVWVPTGQGIGELIISLMPLGRWIRRKLRRRSQPRN